MDYRFLPESTFEEQCSDVKDVEPWLRTELRRELVKEGIEVVIDKRRIIVAGASAGAHLALLTVCHIRTSISAHKLDLTSFPAQALDLITKRNPIALWSHGFP